MGVKDKVIIVTGASSGIGEATAKLLAKKGAKVVLAARSKEKLEKLSNELLNSLVLVTDMSKQEDIRNMVHRAKEHFGRIDGLINNAGIGYDAPIEDIDIEKMRYLIDLNFLGPLIAMQLVIPVMKSQKAGIIVNISSGTALMSIPGLGAYSSLKRALVGLSLTGREELKEYNISVSVVYPFITKTNFGKNVMANKGDKLDTHRKDYTNIPNADSPELVAEKILEAITTDKAEVFVHNWMGK